MRSGGPRALPAARPPAALTRPAGPVLSEEYALEYGTDTLEMHVGAVKEGDRVLLMGIGSGLNCSMAELVW